MPISTLYSIHTANWHIDILFQSILKFLDTDRNKYRRHQ